MFDSRQHTGMHAQTYRCTDAQTRRHTHTGPQFFSELTFKSKGKHIRLCKGDKASLMVSGNNSHVWPDIRGG